MDETEAFGEILFDVFLYIVKMVQFWAILDNGIFSLECIWLDYNWNILSYKLNSMIMLSMKMLEIKLNEEGEEVVQNLKAKFLRLRVIYNEQ